MRRLAVVVVMAGCGGGGDGDGGAEDAALRPKVSFTIPDDGQSDVRPDYPISARFSEEMDGSSINATTFVLMRGTNLVPGTVTYDAEDRTASFDPDERLSLLGSYEAIITRDVTSAAGLRPFADYRWTFEVRDGRWSTPSTVASSFAFRPRVAVDAKGTAVAVANEYIFEPTPDVVATQNTAPYSGWRARTSLNVSESGAAGDPEVVIDRSGVVTVVFRDPTPGTRPVARRHVPDVGWEDPATLHDVDRDVGGLQLTVDPGAVITAVWTSGTDVLANRYVPGAGWSASATTIDSLAGVVLAAPALGSDGAGNVIATWVQHDGGRDNVYWNRADSSGAWQSAAMLELDDGAEATAVHLAVASDGRAAAVYRMESSAGSQFHAKVFDGNSWGDATPIADGIGVRGSLAWAPDGAAWFAYESLVDGGGSDIVVRTYTSSGGWSSPTSIETDEFEDAVEPEIAIDEVGNAIVVWRDGSNVWFNRYVPGSGWLTASEIQHNDTREATSPALGVGPHGEAAVVWQLRAGTDQSIYGSVFR